MSKRNKTNRIRNFQPPKPKSTTLKMRDNHTWQAPDGYKIIVADRGAVSFNVPSAWLIVKMEPLELNDAEPPDDEARISMSFWRMAPGIDWSALPLGPLLEQATENLGEGDEAGQHGDGADKPEYEILERWLTQTYPREDLEMVWMQHRFLDPVEKREAYSRFLMARGFDVHCLITVDFWADDAARIVPIWEEIARSLQLGRVIEDPTKGPTLH